MPAYQIANVTITDAEGFAEYAAQAAETVERYGGRYLSRGGAFEVLEGNWAPNRLVLIEWDSLEQAKRWYESDEYKPLGDMRRRCAETDLVFVEGL